MVPKCGVCHGEDSKYKCPTCELRYCSLNCYKTHKTTHAADDSQVSSEHVQARPPRDRPGTIHRVPKVGFTNFENDPDLKRLLSRYPLLKLQLQAVYGLTLEPGPDEARTWFRQPLPGDTPAQHERGGRGRGRGRWQGRGGRGGRGRGDFHQVSDDRQRGPWTQEKGDKEALSVIKKMRDGATEDKAEGMKEFVELCQIKFGQGRTAGEDHVTQLASQL